MYMKGGSGVSLKALSLVKYVWRVAMPGVCARGVHEFGVCLLPETPREPVHICIHQANHPRYGTSQHSTSHNGPGITHKAVKAISVRSSQDSSTWQHKRPTSHPGRLSCRSQRPAPPTRTSVELRGLDVGLGLGFGLGLLLATARRHSRHRCGGVALRECDAGGRAEAHDGTAARAGGGEVVRGG